MRTLSPELLDEVRTAMRKRDGKEPDEVLVRMRARRLAFEREMEARESALKAERPEINDLHQRFQDGDESVAGELIALLSARVEELKKRVMGDVLTCPQTTDLKGEVEGLYFDMIALEDRVLRQRT